MNDLLRGSQALKTDIVEFFRKKSYCGKKAQNLKQGFLAIYVSFFTLKMIHSSVIYGSAKTACQEKIWFFSCDLKCSQLITLQYSLTVSISAKNQLIPQIFLDRDNHQGNIASETTFFACVWLVVPIVCQITASLILNISGRNILIQIVFVEIIIKGKQHLKTTIFGWVWSVSPLVQSGFFGQQHLKEISIDILGFLHGDNHQGKVASEITNFG